MTEDFFARFTDYAASPDREDGMSSNERRLRSLRNLTMSNASKMRKKKRKLAGEAARRMTEAERLMREQERILAEREMRREMSERNREDAAALAYETALEEAAASAQSSPDLNGEPEINIDIPTGDEPEKPEQKKPSPGQKKRKKTKKTKKHSKPARSAGTSQKKSDSGTAKSGRYSRTGGSSGTYQNRITTGGAITLGILCGVLIGTVIYGRVQLNEVYTEIGKMQTEYDDLTAKNISMRSEMEGKMTVKNIEEYAQNVLGLRPLNQSQITYIQLQTEDAVTITEPEDNFFVRINDKLVGFWEFLRGK